MNINMNEIRKVASKSLEVNAMGNDKIQRYDWTTSGAPGALQSLDKRLLHVNPLYQRDAAEEKVLSMARGWSWVACGAIVVACRDGIFWVIDGQHRVLAALRRSDIQALPCLVFALADIKSEAQGFIDLNTGRKPVSAIAKQKALVTAGDEAAIFVQQEIDRLGLQISASARASGTIQAIAWCVKRAREDKNKFSMILQLVTEISRHEKAPIRERVLDGLWFLDDRMENGLTDKRLLKKIKEKGADALFVAANKAAAYYGSGGAKVWGEGILAELNRGLVHKFELAAA